MDKNNLKINISNILKSVSTKLKTSFNSDLLIETKNGKNDLVTNMDKEVERFIITELKKSYPTAKFVSEEGYGDDIKDINGLVFFVDPIDGTLNYVKQRKDFASMIGVYLDGEPILGAIIDVMADKLYVGGPGSDILVNNKKLITISDHSLSDSLITVSARLVFNEELNMKEVIKKSSGIRMMGSAGVVFGRLLENRQGAYISKLAPWDLAAGKILAESLGYIVVGIDGRPVNMLKSQLVIIGTKQLTQEVLTILN
ncbi:fructose 1,6-bisphosphatase [Companilactobacillus sp. RD055328]|uniref:inositol monophosphatase family protein n=1 Tax=Companilactobacillus sp. RD055328 TaxID=2916634 RepID=UPI001FC851DA|nr:inositol monophosphatase family protein [Companilactobacillus sp. RD055328]GKQ42820.1 fructose 1,6-bisphosphatase [Companilactobacillus sp. RD055328]